MQVAKDASEVIVRAADAKYIDLLQYSCNSLDRSSEANSLTKPIIMAEM